MQAQAVFAERVPFDSPECGFWSVSEGEYICYFRTWKTQTQGKVLALDLTHDEQGFYPLDGSSGDGIWRHAAGRVLYQWDASLLSRCRKFILRHGQAIFPRQSGKLPEEQARTLRCKIQITGSLPVDSIFMTARAAGSHYERTFLEAFIRPGPTPEDWIAPRQHRAGAGGGSGERARDVYLSVKSHYAQPSVSYTWPDIGCGADGFYLRSCVPYAGGELITKPFKFSGSHLELNIETSAAGSLRVEIQDGKWSPTSGIYPGGMPGNDRRRRRPDSEVRWSGGDNASSCWQEKRCVFVSS